MYKIYIEKVLFPVAPEEISTKIRDADTSINLISGGEVDILKQPKLTEISMKLLLPNHVYPWAVYQDGQMHGSQYYLDILEDLKVNRKSFKLKIVRPRKTKGSKITEPLPRTSMLCTLKDYEIKENAGNNNDVEVTVKFKRYVKFGTKQVKLVKDNDGKVKMKRGTTRTTKKGTLQYKTKKGDTLYLIARKYLQNGALGNMIYKANKEKIEAAAKKNGRKSSAKGKFLAPGIILNLGGKVSSDV